MTASTTLTLSLLAALLGACASSPPRFSLAPPVLEVPDDASIPVPAQHAPVELIAIAEAYVRRPLSDALTAQRTPHAGDVNSLDEVPRSSWFAPTEAPLELPRPRPPLRLLAEAPLCTDAALVVRDSAGVRFELLADSEGHPELRSGVSALGAALLSALGYRVPNVGVVQFATGDFLPPVDPTALAALPQPSAQPRRYAAIEWPPGLDVGPTPRSHRREDDPNDRVPHADRRTLRALKPFLGWLGVHHLPESALRDVYVGAPGRGHLQHYFVGTEAVLGGGDDEPVRDGPLLLDGTDAWKRLLTLGALPARDAAQPARSPWFPGLDVAVDLEHLSVSPPFDPFERALPGDLYWAARQLLRLDDATLAEAIGRARFSAPAAAAEAMKLLRERRRTLVAQALRTVTPCELDRVDEGALQLVDLAVREGFEDASSSRYEVSWLDSEGASIGSPNTTVAGCAARVRFVLPTSAPDYLIARVVAWRGVWRSPRAVDVHLADRGGGYQAIGLRR